LDGILSLFNNTKNFYRYSQNFELFCPFNEFENCIVYWEFTGLTSGKQVLVCKMSKISFVVFTSYEDTYECQGITGEVTPEQEKILMDAACTDGDDDQNVMALSILRAYEYDDDFKEESEEYKTVKEHIFNEEQIVELTNENWPRYPVKTVGFAPWC